MYLFKGHVLVNFPYCGDQIFNKKKRPRGGGAYYRVTDPYVRLERYIPRPGKQGGRNAWRPEHEAAGHAVMQSEAERRQETG